MVDEIAHAERGDPVSNLIKRDYAAGYGFAHPGETLLPETDGYGQQGRATQPSETENGDAEPRLAIGQRGDQRKRCRPGRRATRDT